MVIARLVKEKLSSNPAGVVLTTRDFGVEMRYQPALAKALNRLVLQGELQKIAKGKYYIPKKTIFGNLKPADSELVKDFLEQNGKIVGYITGTAAFAAMGLTTQISSSILVGTNKYRRPITRNGVKISFLLQENAITSSNIPLLRILDALRLIKDIPATSPDECVTNICKAINALSMEQKRELAELSLAYTPYVRALLDAVQKGHRLNETDAKNLLERGLVEGEYPDLTISLSIARQTKQLPEYTKVKGLERDKIKHMALQFIQNAGEEGTRREFVIEYLRETLPARNTKEQNQRLVGNILAEMNNEGSITQKDRTWYATTSKD